MALKFRRVSEPHVVSEGTPCVIPGPTVPARKPRARKVRRSSMKVAKPERKIVVQDYAIDDYGELPARKREALEAARKLGHDLMPWAARENDPAGRYNAFCTTCNAAVVVCTDTPPHGLPFIYGPAITKECRHN